MDITPEQIDAERHFWNAFGHMETETSARWIVQFCQQRGQGWEPFTREQIEQFYNAAGYQNFWFNSLVSQGYIRDLGDEYEITPEFVERCYKASPRFVNE